MSRFQILFVALLVACGSAAPAIAQRGDDRSFAGFQVSRATAVDIARAHGVRDVLEVKARKGVWKVEGRDRDGRRIEVAVDGFTGAVVKVSHRD